MKNTVLVFALMLSYTSFSQSFQSDNDMAVAFKDFGKGFEQMDTAFVEAFKDFDEGFANFDIAFQMNELKDTAMNQTERTYLVELFKQTQEKFENSIKNVTPEQASFKATLDSWSINEVLEHIVIVETGIFNILQSTLQQPADPSRRSEIKVSDEEVLARLTNRNGKAKSPERLQPTGKFPNTQVAKVAFQNQHATILSFIHDTDSNLRNRYWNHPVTGVIDLYQTLVLLAAHTQRHLAQIEEIKTTPNYPTK